jgi:hypothetical protein
MQQGCTQNCCHTQLVNMAIWYVLLLNLFMHHKYRTIEPLVLNLHPYPMSNGMYTNINGMYTNIS